jgi:hypothetical protein
MLVVIVLESQIEIANWHFSSNVNNDSIISNPFDTNPRNIHCQHNP